MKFLSEISSMVDCPRKHQFYLSDELSDKSICFTIHNHMFSLAYPDKRRGKQLLHYQHVQHHTALSVEQYLMLANMYTKVMATAEAL